MSPVSHTSRPAFAPYSRANIHTYTFSCVLASMKNTTLDSSTQEEIADAQAALSKLGDCTLPQRPRVDAIVAKSDQAIDDAQRAAESQIASQFQAIAEFTVDNIGPHLQGLVDVLDYVSRVHPFVAVAALAFKAALELEITRQENDKRILQLHADMCNTMRLVAWLCEFQDQYPMPDKSISLQERLGQCIKDIATDIKECAKKCAAFRDKNPFTRMLFGSYWEKIFVGFSQKFETHQKNVHRVLSAISTLIASASHVELRAIGHTLKLFTELRPLKERKTLEFVDGSGGSQAILQDQVLLEEFKALAVQAWSSEDDERFSYVYNEIGRDLQDLQLEMQTMLQHHQEGVEKLFEKQWDRLYTALQAGAVGRNLCTELQDSDIRKLWIDNNWTARPNVNIVVEELLRFAGEQMRPLQGVSALPASPVDSWATKFLTKEWGPGCHSFSS